MFGRMAIPVTSLRPGLDSPETGPIDLSSALCYHSPMKKVRA